jgi:hypothetical protein
MEREVRNLLECRCNGEGSKEFSGISGRYGRELLTLKVSGRFDGEGTIDIERYLSGSMGREQLTLKGIWAVRWGGNN